MENKRINKKREVPISEKVLLTIEEAAAYSGIGINKIRDLAEEKNVNFVLYNGNRRLIKRRLFEQFLLESEVV